MSFINKTFTPGETEVFYMSELGRIQKGLIIDTTCSNGDFVIKGIVEFRKKETIEITWNTEIIAPSEVFSSLLELFSHIQNLDKP